MKACKWKIAQWYNLKTYYIQHFSRSIMVPKKIMSILLCYNTILHHTIYNFLAGGKEGEISFFIFDLKRAKVI